MHVTLPSGKCMDPWLLIINIKSFQKLKWLENWLSDHPFHAYKVNQWSIVSCWICRFLRHFSWIFHSNQMNLVISAQIESRYRKSSRERGAVPALYKLLRINLHSTFVNYQNCPSYRCIFTFFCLCQKMYNCTSMGTIPSHVAKMTNSRHAEDWT